MYLYFGLKSLNTNYFQCQGTGKIKGIMAEFPKPNVITLNATSFSGMDNLEIFINRNAILSGHIKYLPNKLKLLDWGRCQLRSLPSKFYAMHLAVFNMPCSSMRKLEKFKVTIEIILIYYYFKQSSCFWNLEGNC